MTQYLCDSLFELGALQCYASDCEDAEIELNTSLVRMLLAVIYNKIYYFSTKYKFQVEDDDQIFPENLFDFTRKFHEFDGPRREALEKQLREVRQESP